MEARSVPTSELEESRMTLPEPNGRLWAEKQCSEREDEMSVESLKDTGQQESTVVPDHTLGLEDSGRTFEDSEDVRNQPDHTMAYEARCATSGMPRQCWASDNGPHDAPFLDDPQQSQRPEDINGHQQQTLNSEEVCHQGDDATGQEDVCSQPGKSPESVQILDQTNNTVESTTTIHQPQNIQEWDKVSDQQGTTIELEKTSGQLHNTMEREEISDHPHNTTESKEISDQPHNTMEREEISDQPHNTMERELLNDQSDNLIKSIKVNDKVYNTVTSNGIGDQADNTTKSEISDHSDTLNDQENNTPGSIEICDEYSNISDTNVHKQPNKCIGFTEISDQQHNAGEFKITSDLHTTIECDELSSEPLCQVELKETNDQPEKSRSSEGNNVQPHSDSNCKSFCEQVHYSTQSKCVIDNPDHGTESNEIRDQPHMATESECIDNPDHGTESNEIRDQPHMATESECIDHQVCTNDESTDPSDKAPNTMESKEFNDPEIATNSKIIGDQSADIIEPKEIRIQPNNTRESKEICDHQENPTESKEIRYRPENTPGIKDTSVQPVVIRERRKRSDQPDNILDSEENSDQPAKLKAPKGISDESDNTGMSFEVRAHSAHSSGSQKIGNQLERSGETRGNGDQLGAAAETIEISEESENKTVSIEITNEPENVIESEENSNRSPNSAASKVISNTLPAVFVGIEELQGVHPDGESRHLYALKNDHRVSSIEGSATLGAMLEECGTGITSSSELWEIPFQCLTPNEHVVEHHSGVSSLAALPSVNSHHRDTDPETRVSLVGPGTVGYQTEWTRHPDTTLEISSFSLPFALSQDKNSSVVMEEATFFEGVDTMCSRSSVDDSSWAADGQGDVAFQAYGQQDTVSSALQVGHGSDVTESKVPALGAQCEDKLQRDISQPAKSSSSEPFSRPESDLKVGPTIGDLSEEEESAPDLRRSSFPSHTNDEETAFDGLLDRRDPPTEDVPDGKRTHVHPLVSKDKQPLQRATHEHPFGEGLRAPLCLPKERTDVHEPHQQVETDRSQDMDSGEADPLASRTDPAFPSEELILQSWLVDPVVGGFNEVEEYFGEGPPEVHNVPVRAQPFAFNVDFKKFHSQVPTLLQGAGEDGQELPAASSPADNKADYEVHAADVMENHPLDTSSAWETDNCITGSSSASIQSQTPEPIHFFNPSAWLEQSRRPGSFAAEDTPEPHDDHVRFCSSVNPQVFLNNIPVSPPIYEPLHRGGSVLGVETSPMPDASPASENVFLSPQVRFAPVTVIAGTAEPKTPSSWMPTWKVPDDSVLQALTRKIVSPKLSRRALKVHRTNDGAGAAETPHRRTTPVLVSHHHLAEEKALGEGAGREPDRLPSPTPKLFQMAPVLLQSKALFKQLAVSEEALCPNALEDPQSKGQSTCEAAGPEQGVDPVQLRQRLDPLVSSNIFRRHSKLVNSSRLLYQEYSDVALNHAIERQKRAETFLEESEPSSPRLRRKLMSSPDSYLQRLSVSSSASLWQDIPMIRGTSTLLSMTREEQKLQEAKFELIMSEASYLRSLNIAVDHFQHSPDLQSLLSNQERQWLFSRLQEVRDVSANFLFDLEEKFEDNMYTFNVCDVVLSHSPAFRKVYVPYVTNQSYQDQTFQRLLSGNPRFQQVLQKLESDPMCQRLSLKSFLILPFQRITRLKLVVQNILKRTRPGSREEGQATQAYSLLEKLIKDCNENVQRMRSTEELIYLSQKIEFECKIFPLISQSRRLVKHGELVELESSAHLSFKWKVITRPIYLHLFNDCLLLSRRREGARFLVFDHARVSKVNGEKCEMKMHGNSKNIFRLILQENNQGRRTEFLLRTETQSEKLRWISALSPQKKKPDFLQCHDNPQVQCLKSYKAREHDELSLEKADVLMVTQQSKDGWMEGTRLSDSEHGWFPVENVEDISNKHVRLRNLKEEQRVQYARAKLIPPHQQR